MGRRPRPFTRSRATITPVTKIADLIEPSLSALGFELVLARLHGGSRPRLQIMAEPLDRARGMTVDDCAEISHAVSAVLDVADPIIGAYTLEVSSPGIDRPLVKPADFERFKGAWARVETTELLDGRRRFAGRLDGIEGSDLRLVCEGVSEPLRLPLGGIAKARLAAEPPPETPIRKGRKAPAGKPKETPGRSGHPGHPSRDEAGPDSAETTPRRTALVEKTT